MFNSIEQVIIPALKKEWRKRT